MFNPSLFFVHKNIKLMPISDKHIEKKYRIEHISSPTELIRETLLYDRDGSKVSVIPVVEGTPHYYWMSYNFFQKLNDNTSTFNSIFYEDQYLADFTALSINQESIGDRIKPSSFQLHIPSSINPYALKFTDWDQNTFGGVFSITGADSLAGSLSSGYAGSTTTGFTVDILFRPYPSVNERCLFHRWTTRESKIYSNFIGSEFISYDESVEYLNWGTGAFLGEDSHGTYVDFFVYGDNTSSLTGTLVAADPIPPDGIGTTVTGEVSIISTGEATTDPHSFLYRFAILHYYDFEGAPYPMMFSASAYAPVFGAIGGKILYTLSGSSSGQFSGIFSYSFFNNNTGRIANTVDTRYYLPRTKNIYDGDFHRLQFVWSTSVVPQGVAFYDGVEITNKTEHGDGRVTPISYSLTGSASATPFSIFGFIEANAVGDVTKYAESGNTTFGELCSFVMYDTALYKSALVEDPYLPVRLLSGHLSVNGERYFFDPLSGFQHTTSASVNNVLQSYYSGYLYEFRQNVVLYFDMARYAGAGNDIVDIAVTNGMQYTPTTGHLGHIFQKNAEGRFERVSNMIFDIDDSAPNAVRSSLDWVSKNSEGAEILSQLACTKLYYREGIFISNTGSQVNYGSYDQVGVLDYDRCVGFVYSGVINKFMQHSMIAIGVEKTYSKVVEIDVEGEFFTRSENESGWFQQTVGTLLPKSPTKYITGLVIYDEDGDPMIVGKFPKPMKKTIYDDLRIKLKI
jgi:hypothetical protein